VSPIDPRTRIRSVTLAVRDLQRSADFYEHVLGLRLIAREGRRARLGPDASRPALELAELESPAPLTPHDTGLYHVAWLHPSRAALAATVRRILDARWPFEGASDHGVSEALYLSDPDGLGIEVYTDRPRERWQAGPDGGGVDMITLPLDVEDLLAQAPAQPQPTIDPATAVGHVHLKVADVPRAVAFYDGTLGFEQMARLPSAAFLAAGGYHHHLGVNSWQTAGAAPASAGAPGLRLIEFELPDAAAVDALDRAIAQDPAAEEPQHAPDGSLRVHDPDGQLLAFAASERA
jgi:catechol 2,3-dioxygenase